MPTATPARSDNTTEAPPSKGNQTATARLRSAATRPVAAESVAVARMLFGALVAYSSIRFIAKGWVGQLWIEPTARLTYPGFEWVQPLPGNWMYLLPVLTAAAGVAIAAGFRHRLATLVFLITFTWTELIDASLYLNHYWFLTLVGMLMMVLPVHHYWSLDAAFGRVQRYTTVPAVVVWALRAQVGVVYVFAGLAKLNPDWLLRGQPLTLWLSDRSDVPLVGPLLDLDAFAIVASWGAAAFDLTIVGWLLWRRSRPLAWALVVAFHVITGALFQIGVFPLVMTAMALVFFEPNWPVRWSRLLVRVRPRFRRQLTTASHTPLQPWLILFLGLMAALQVFLPMRHFAAPGNVRWNEDGSYLAWRVMLTEKAGFAEYRVTNVATGRTTIADPNEVLTDWQAGHASTRPDLIHATALLIEQRAREHHNDPIEIRVDAWVSMNGRPAARLIDPDVNLLAYERGALPEDAVLALPRSGDG